MYHINDFQNSHLQKLYLVSGIKTTKSILMFIYTEFILCMFFHFSYLHVFSIGSVFTKKYRYRQFQCIWNI